MRTLAAYGAAGSSIPGVGGIMVTCRHAMPDGLEADVLAAFADFISTRPALLGRGVYDLHVHYEVMKHVGPEPSRIMVSIRTSDNPRTGPVSQEEPDYCMWDCGWFEVPGWRPSRVPM